MMGPWAQPAPSPAAVLAAAGQPPHCPFPVRVHPDAAGIAERHAAWVRSSGVAADTADAERILAWDVPFYAARCWAEVDTDQADLGADLTAWILAADTRADAADSPAALSAACETIHQAAMVLDNPTDSGLEVLLADPFLAAWGDVARRLWLLLEPPVYRLTSRALHELWLDIVCGGVRQFTGHVADEQRYLVMRAYGGMVANAALCWPATMPVDLWWEPEVQALLVCANQILAYTNDWFSAPQEVHEGRPVNLADVAARIAALYERFDLVLAGPVDALGEDATGWVTRIRQYLAGNHAWCAHTPRYQPPAAPHGDQDEERVTP